MTPEKSRDKLDLLHAARGDNARLEAIFDQCVGVVIARLCFTRQEALEEMAAYAARKTRAASHRAATDEARA